jgi:hypothetical protein
MAIKMGSVIRIPIYRALGVDPANELRDRLGRPLRLCTGEAMTPLYTTAPI